MDAATNLHLKITNETGNGLVPKSRCESGWVLADINFKSAAGLLSLMTKVVLGLFNYPTRDVGPDGTHEIDIEFARWGNDRTPIGHYTIRRRSRSRRCPSPSGSPWLMTRRRTGLFGAARA